MKYLTLIVLLFFGNPVAAADIDQKIYEQCMASRETKPAKKTAVCTTYGNTTQCEFEERRSFDRMAIYNAGQCTEEALRASADIEQKSDLDAIRSGFELNLHDTGTWSNGRSSGAVTVSRVGVSATGAECREFQITYAPSTLKPPKTLAACMTKGGNIRIHD